jgi:hypothetical protein
MEKDDQDAYMLKKELTYHQITDQVESCYINLLNKKGGMDAGEECRAVQVWS